MTRCFVLLFTAVALGFCCPAAPGKEPEPLKPINLDQLNTDKDEDEPHLTSNGLQLLYTRQAKGKAETLISARQTTSQPWPPGKPLPDLQGQADCRSVFLTADGGYPQHLYYATNRDPEKKDGKGDNFDLYFLVRQGPRAAFTPPYALHTVCTAADELHPWLTADGRQLYFSRKDKDGWRVYVAAKPASGGQFGAPKLVELPAGFHHPTLTPDGRTMYLQGSLGKDRWGLFRTTWNGKKWAEPEPLTRLNSPAAPMGERSPSLSRDGSRLYFASDRPGGKGGLDLWVIATAELSRKPK